MDFQTLNIFDYSVCVVIITD